MDSAAQGGSILLGTLQTAEALVKWLWGMIHVVGSNPGAVNWMDMTFFTLNCCINCFDLFEKTENNQKEAGVGHLKNNNYYYYL